MEKRLCKFTCVVTSIFIAFVFSGCRAIYGGSHTHTFSTEWTSNETYHWHSATCEHSDLTSDKAKHSFPEDWTEVTASTEDEEGLEERLCKECSYKITRSIPALPHTHKAGELHEAVSGDCQTKGTLAYYDCTKSNCTVKLDSEGNILESIEGSINPSVHKSSEGVWIKTETTHKQIYDCCSAIIIEEAAHDFPEEWAVVTESTEETEGQKHRFCKICNYEVKQSIPQLNHTHKTGTKHEAVAGDCQNKGTIEYYDCTKSSCTAKLDKDAKALESIEGTLGTHVKGTHHEAVSGNCTDKGTVEYWDCSVEACNKNLDSEGKELESIQGTTNPSVHKSDSVIWEQTETTHKGTYSCCGVVKVEEAEHTYGDWTSNKDATTEADGTESHVCTVCGYKEQRRDYGSKIGLVKISGGTITGSDENWCWENSSYHGVFIKDRIVTLSNFIISDHEVTKAEYQTVMESSLNTEGITADPSLSTNQPAKYVKVSAENGNLQPVENVTWYDAVYYCNLLSQKEGLDSVYTITEITTSESTIENAGESGTETVTVKYIKSAKVSADHSKNGYRLPTEAEWEYAARGGNPEALEWKYEYAGADSTEASAPSSDSAIDAVGWYKYNAANGGITSTVEPSDADEGYATHQIKLKASNSLGLYDMCGNVWEWCYDKRTSISTGEVTDPVGTASSTSRVRRGGSWHQDAKGSSVCTRNESEPTSHNGSLGFRVVRSAN